MSKRSAQYDPSQEVDALPFTDALMAVHDGNFAADCALKMKECAEHVMKKGGKTKLSLSLTFSAAAGGGVNLAAEVTSKLPPPAARSQFLYSDRDGKLYEHDPREVELELAMEMAKPPVGPQAEYTPEQAEKVMRMPGTKRA